MQSILSSRAKEDFILVRSKDLEEAMLALKSMTDVRARLTYKKLLSKNPDLRCNIENILGDNTKAYATTSEDLEEFREFFDDTN